MSTNPLNLPAFQIAATDRSPHVDFDFDAGRLRMRGESYPEDVTSFYRPVLDALDKYFGALGTGDCRFELSLIYFNSASAKVIMFLMEMLDAAAAKGAGVDLFWYYDPEDDTMQELGEEFGEDLEHARFHLEAMVRDAE